MIKIYNEKEAFILESKKLIEFVNKINQDYDLNLNVEETYLAMTIGLLHDYARFEQWTNHKTYIDSDSIDHGDLAVKILFDDNEIVKYSLKEENSFCS